MTTSASEFEKLWDLAMGEAFTRSDSAGQAPPASAAPETPRYRVIREIASGGMGKVVLARDATLEREVAMKVIRPDLRLSEKTRARFIREAVIAGQLQHPGVVPVYELGTDPSGDVFMTMRPLGGRTLADLLQSPDRLLMPMLRILEQVGQTMAYAHSRGVIHRDLKPDNIMVGAFGEVQVLDWGLAKVLGGTAAEEPVDGAMSPGPANLSAAGTVLGTPMYMAPEQALGDVAAVDERTDVFSLGAILCEILTGSPPYTDRDSSTAITRAAKADLDEAYLRIRSCLLDPELKQIALDCMARSKADRPKSAAAVAGRLSAYLGGIAERARLAEVRAAEEGVRAVGERRARRLVTALAAAAVLLVVGGAAVLWRRAEARRESIHEAEAAIAEAAERASRGDWAGAEESAGRAEAGARKDGLEPALVDHAKSKREEYGARRRERELMERIEALRTGGAGPPERFEQACRALFADIGIDFDGSLAEAGARVRAMGEPVRRMLVQALDNWAARCPPDRQATWARAVEMAAASDDDPWRNRLRRAMVGGDAAAIREMAESLDDAPRPPESFLLLGQGIHRSRLGYGLESRLLIEAQRRHPGDFWLNFTIAHRSLEPDGSPDLAERHARLAIAIRPDSADARAILASALWRRTREGSGKPGDLEEAAAVLRIARDLFKHGPPREAVEILQLFVEGRDEEARGRMSEARRRGRHLPPWFMIDGPPRPR